MRNAADKRCGGNQNTHFMLNNFFFPPENRAVYEMWKNTAGRGAPQMTKWRMRNARWIIKTTNTHSEYETLIAFPF